MKKNFLTFLWAGSFLLTFFLWLFKATVKVPDDLTASHYEDEHYEVKKQWMQQELDDNGSAHSEKTNWQLETVPHAIEDQDQKMIYQSALMVFSEPSKSIPISKDLIHLKLPTCVVGSKIEGVLKEDIFLEENHGRLTAQVRENIYDVQGHILIPHGAIMLGEYDYQKNKKRVYFSISHLLTNTQNDMLVSSFIVKGADGLEGLPVRHSHDWHHIVRPLIKKLLPEQNLNWEESVLSAVLPSEPSQEYDLLPGGTLFTLYCQGTKL